MTLWQSTRTGLWTWALAATVAVGAGGAAAQEAEYSEAQIEAVLQLLPPSARDHAGILTRTGPEMVRVREGSNGWTCWVERIGPRMGGNCHHDALEGFLLRKRELASTPVEGETPEATVAREYDEGKLTIPPGSLEITGYGPVDASGLPEDLQGRFFLYFPYATSDELGLPTEPPAAGAPYAHEVGTVQAHVMWSRTVEVRRP